MKLIDEVVHTASDEAVTRAAVGSRWPLVNHAGDNNISGACVDPVVFIELVAQTAAVQVSSRTQKNAADRRGCMVGIRNAEFFIAPVPVGTILTTRIRCVQSIDNYDVLEGEVSSAQGLLCRAEIQVFRE
jgi:predicted hotdog family 3-hydroxylacyl-ACP dehydratase